MSRQDFFNVIAEDYYKDCALSFQKLKTTVKGVFPVFGELEVKVMEVQLNENETCTEVTYIDNDQGDIIIAPEGVDVSEIDTDMSCTVLSFTVGHDGIINTVNSNMGFFTRANKDILLFSGFLIGKKVIFD